MTKVLRIGILGTGWIAEKMARTISGMDEERGIQLFAVASRSLDKARLFATQWNIPKAFGSYDELASDKEVDLIYVATPH